MKADYTFEILSEDHKAWINVPFISFDLNEKITWNEVDELNIAVDNHNGDNRELCRVGSQCHLLRNKIPIFHGIVQEPVSGVSSTAQTLNIRATDYYKTKLQDKLCDPSYIWNVENMDAEDLIRQCIGTRLLVNENFKNDQMMYIHDGVAFQAYNDTVKRNRYAALAPIADAYSTYPPSAEMTSNPLQNSDWTTMGEISVVRAEITGSPHSDPQDNINLVLNNGFEEDFNYWNVTNVNYDTSWYADTCTQFKEGFFKDTECHDDFLLPTNWNTPSMELLYTTDEDFNTGTLDQLRCVDGALQLDYIHQLAALEVEAPAATVSFEHTDTTTEDFNTGSYEKLTGENDQISQIPISGDWLAGYDYRKAIKINGSVDAVLINHTVRINLKRLALFDEPSESVVSLEGHNQSWSGEELNDIRFTGSDGVTLYNYCIEQFNLEDAIVWVQIPQLEVSGTTLFIYYGKKNDTSASDSSIFVFYENWENLSNWEISDPATVFFDPELHTMTLKVDLNTVDAATLSTGGYTNWGFNVNTELIVNTSSMHVGSLCTEGVGFNVVSPVTGEFGAMYYGSLPDFSSDTCMNIEHDIKSVESFSEAATPGSYRRINIKRVIALDGAPEVVYTRNDTDTLTIRNNAITEPLKILFCVNRGALNQALISSGPLLVRTTTLNEPTISSIELEEAGSWRENFLYRKPIKVTGSIDGELNNHSMRLTLQKGAGTDSNTTIFLNNNCLHFPEDIRFTNSDGETLLGYWLESGSGDSGVTNECVWVNIPYLPAAPEYITIYIYYGRDEAINNFSDGNSVFTFFDDFKGEEYNQEKWVRREGVQGPGHIITPLAGELVISGGSTLISRAQPAKIGTITGIRAYFYTSPYPSPSIYADCYDNTAIGVGWGFSNGYDGGFILGYAGGSPPYSFLDPRARRFIWEDMRTHNYNQYTGSAMDADPEYAGRYATYLIKRNLSGTTTIRSSDGYGWTWPNDYDWQSKNFEVFLDTATERGVDHLNGPAHPGTLVVDWVYVYEPVDHGPTLKTGAETTTINFPYCSAGMYTSQEIFIEVTHSVIQSKIDWTAYVPAGGNINVEVQVGGGFNPWLPVIKGGSIPGLGLHEGDSKIRYRVTMYGKFESAILYDITLSVDFGNYTHSGSWVSPPIDISKIGLWGWGTVSWHGELPAPCSIILSVSKDDGANWVPLGYNGDYIPLFNFEENITNITAFRMKAEFATEDSAFSPTITDLLLTICAPGDYASAGYWISPDIDISYAKVWNSGTLNWLEKSGNGGITYKVSKDGLDWIEINRDGDHKINGIFEEGEDISRIKSFKIKVEFMWEGGDPPMVDELMLSIISNLDSTIKIDTDNPYKGDKCAFFTTNRFYPCESATLISDPIQVSPLTKYVFGTWHMGENLKAQLIEYSKEGIYLKTTDINIPYDAEYAFWTSVLNTNGDTGLVVIKFVITSDIPDGAYIDDVYLVHADDSLELQVARDRGLWQGDAATWYPLSLIYFKSSGKWYGTVDLSDDVKSTIKNSFGYHLKLMSNSEHTSSPIIDNIKFNIDTVSDVDITEGKLAIYNDPLHANDLLTLELNKMSRLDAIDKIFKITGHEATISPDGRFDTYIYSPNTPPTDQWGVGTDLINFNRDQNRDDMINALTYISSGRFSTNENVEFTLTYNIQDAPSIALYGRKEGILKESGFNAEDMVNTRGWQLLQEYKLPTDKISGCLSPERIKGLFPWERGDNILLIDSSNVTGINGVYRLVSASISVDVSGEYVNVELSVRKMGLKDATKLLADQISEIAHGSAADRTPSYVSYHDNISNEYPAKLFLWIDPERSDRVKDIMLTVFSEKFRSYSEGTFNNDSETTAAGGGGTSGVENTHTHNIIAPEHQHLCYTANLNYLTTSTAQEHQHFTIGPGEVVTAITNVKPQLSSANNSASAEGSVHAHQISAHTHTISGHTHEMIYGIYEYAKTATCKLFINDLSVPNKNFGTPGAFTTSGEFQLIRLSLIKNYNKEYSGANILGPGVNTLYLRPQCDVVNNPLGLLRICANVEPIYG